MSSRQVYVPQREGVGSSRHIKQQYTEKQLQHVLYVLFCVWPRRTVLTTSPAPHAPDRDM